MRKKISLLVTICILVGLVLSDIPAYAIQNMGKLVRIEQPVNILYVTERQKVKSSDKAKIYLKKAGKVSAIDTESFEILWIDKMFLSHYEVKSLFKKAINHGKRVFVIGEDVSLATISSNADIELPEATTNENGGHTIALGIENFGTNKEPRYFVTGFWVDEKCQGEDRYDFEKLSEVAAKPIVDGVPAEVWIGSILKPAEAGSDWPIMTSYQYTYKYAVVNPSNSKETFYYYVTRNAVLHKASSTQDQDSQKDYWYVHHFDETTGPADREATKKFIRKELPGYTGMTTNLIGYAPVKGEDGPVTVSLSYPSSLSVSWQFDADGYKFSASGGTTSNQISWELVPTLLEGSYMPVKIIFQPGATFTTPQGGTFYEKSYHYVYYFNYEAKTNYLSIKYPK